MVCKMRLAILYGSPLGVRAAVLPSNLCSVVGEVCGSDGRRHVGDAVVNLSMDCVSWQAGETQMIVRSYTAMFRSLYLSTPP